MLVETLGNSRFKGRRREQNKIHPNTIFDLSKFNKIYYSFVFKIGIKIVYNK